MTDWTRRPVLGGLLALAVVSIVVGLIAGLGAVIGVKATGVGGGSSAGGQASGDATMFLPEPKVTDDPSASTQPPSEPEPGSSESAAPAGIELSADQQRVGPMDQIDLTGTYPGGDGVVLQVQRKADGNWQDFPVTAVVSGQTFSTYVQTSQLGENTFRVIDISTDKASNEVTIEIG